jgi:hypothetical protein
LSPALAKAANAAAMPPAPKPLQASESQTPQSNLQDQLAQEDPISQAGKMPALPQGKLVGFAGKEEDTLEAAEREYAAYIESQNRTVAPKDTPTEGDPYYSQKQKSAGLSPYVDDDAVNLPRQIGYLPPPKGMSKSAAKPDPLLDAAAASNYGEGQAMPPAVPAPPPSQRAVSPLPVPYPGPQPAHLLPAQPVVPSEPEPMPAASAGSLPGQLSAESYVPNAYVEPPSDEPDADAGTLPICPSCGNGLEANARFCGECGYSLPERIMACSGCALPLEPGAKFCGECGTPVPAAPEQSASAQADDKGKGGIMGKLRKFLE